MPAFFPAKNLIIWKLNNSCARDIDILMLSCCFFAFCCSHLDSNFTLVIISPLTDTRVFFFIEMKQFFSNLIMTIIDTNRFFFLVQFLCCFTNNLYDYLPKQTTKTLIDMLMFPQKNVFKPHNKSTWEIVCQLDQLANHVRRKKDVYLAYLIN